MKETAESLKKVWGGVEGVGGGGKGEMWEG
jgi:hypothetical protein